MMRVIDEPEIFPGLDNIGNLYTDGLILFLGKHRLERLYGLLCQHHHLSPVWLAVFCPGGFVVGKIFRNDIDLGPLCSKGRPADFHGLQQIHYLPPSVMLNLIMLSFLISISELARY